MIEISIDGLNNVRDLGGYITADGRRVKSGLIYRGIRLEELSPKGKEQFCCLGIKNIFDLRDPTQAKRCPDPEIPGARYNLTPAEVYSEDELGFDMATIPSISDEEARRRIEVHEEHYRTIARKPTAIKAIIECILSGGAPVYFHCTAGKDRTGFTAAVILAALGVPFKTIMEDYMLSASRRAEHAKTSINQLYGTAPDGERGELLRCYFTVDERWLNLAWDVVNHEFGGIDDYLERVLGLDRERQNQLKQLCLEEI